MRSRTFARQSILLRYRPAIECLEARQLLSTCHVTRRGDTGGGFGLRGDLRYCIDKVNEIPGADAIDFKVTGTIELASALPHLQGEIDVVGPGTDLLAITAQRLARVFYVEANATAGISALVITGGNDANGGGVYNEGHLTIEDCLITDNTLSTSGYRLGGGIFNSGVLWVFNSAITDNFFPSLLGRGGGIYNEGTLIVDRSLIANNFVGGGFSSSPEGAGIHNRGKATISHTTISGNRGNIIGIATFSGSGGGIHNAGELLVESSLIWRNEISGDYWGFGGGIYNSEGTATIVNSTIHENVAFANGDSFGDARGGGIANNANWSVIIQHSTIAKNRTAAGADYVTAHGGGIATEPHGPIYISNSIVAGNDAEHGTHDIYGLIDSAGHNLISDTNGGSGFVETDILNVDPMLSTLADNGGPTMTMALLPGSPAVDAGDNTDAPEWDQRGPGYPRIVNGSTDIGSFEVQPTGTAKLPDYLGLLLTADWNPKIQTEWLDDSFNTSP